MFGKSTSTTDITTSATTTSMATSTQDEKEEMKCLPLDVVDDSTDNTVP